MVKKLTLITGIFVFVSMIVMASLVLKIMEIQKENPITVDVEIGAIL